jgi:hypothetical protein
MVQDSEVGIVTLRKRPETPFSSHLIPVSIETFTVMDWPVTTVKLLGSAELQPIHWQLERLKEYVPGASDACRDPDALHPFESHEIGSVIATPEGCGVTTALIEEYCDDAGPVVAVALQTGWVGPTLKLAWSVPKELVPVPEEDVLVPALIVNRTSTIDPHSSPAATVYVPGLRGVDEEAPPPAYSATAVILADIGVAMALGPPGRTTAKSLIGWKR